MIEFSDGRKIITAQRLKQLRNNKGLSHEKLATALAEQGVKVSVQALKDYEVTDTAHSKFDSTKGMKIETFFGIAQFYNVSTDYLLGETEVKSIDVNVKAACELTGLNDLSFFRLQHIKNIQKQMDIFNELASPLLFEELLNNINTLMQQTVELKSIEKEYPNFKDEEIKADLSQCCFKEEFEARQTHQRLKLSTFTSRYIIEEQFKKLYLLAVEAQTE